MIISYRRADLLDQFKFQGIIEAWKHYDFHNEKIWELNDKSLRVPSNILHDVVEVLLQVGFRDFDGNGQFKKIIEPGDYMDQYYNKILDILPKFQIKVLQSSLDAENMRIVYEVQ